MIKPVLTGLAVMAVSGCAAVQLPAERLENNQASIRSAEELGAQAVPAARLHLQLAKDQVVVAKRMADKGDKRSVLVLARAQADAELALGLTREVSVRTAAAKADEELKAVEARGTP